jgi:hypothetical protein
VLVLNLGTVVYVNVVTPETKADNCAGIGVGAAALAVSLRALALSGQDAEVDLYPGRLGGFRYLVLQLGFMFWTRS